jgi:hypothetical protein
MSEENKFDFFDEFKNSFNYGSRSDLNFKFLKNYSNEEAADFFRDLLHELSGSIDDEDINKLESFVFRAQAKGYSDAGRFIYDDAPFTQLVKPVSELRLALMTSSGHFVEGNDPKPFDVENLTQQEAESRISEFIRTEPQISEIPVKAAIENLRVRHGGYDISGAMIDPNVNFPLTRLSELQDEGEIGEFFSPAFSFVGACSQTHLLKHTGKEWVKLIQDYKIDALLLVPV